MKKIIICIALCIGINPVFGQKDGKDIQDLTLVIKGLNHQIETLYITKKADALVGYYENDLTYFAEYRPAIFTSDSLFFFYKKWFAMTDISAYKKEIYKIEKISDCILEIGTFRLTYSDESASGKQQEYRGKYMVIWKNPESGKLKIMSEAFGADSYIAPENVPYAKINVNPSDIAPQKLGKQLRSELNEQNKAVIQAVVNGDGNARADGFTENGIYMPHFESILDGMNIVKPYMLKTYNPEAKLLVQHIFYRIFDLGQFVLVNGHFDGSWGNKENGGMFSGNMSNLLKKENGKLLMYCQLVNNDKKPVSHN